MSSEIQKWKIPKFGDRESFVTFFIGRFLGESRYAQELLEATAFPNTIVHINGKDHCELEFDAEFEGLQSGGQDIRVSHPQLGVLVGHIMSKPDVVNYRVKVDIEHFGLTVTDGEHKGFTLSYVYNPVSRGRMLDALRRFQEVGLPELPQMEAALLGERMEPFEMVADEFVAPELNDPQRKAVALCLAAPVSHICGPPGKTFTFTFSLGKSINGRESDC